MLAVCTRLFFSWLFRAWVQGYFKSFTHPRSSVIWWQHRWCKVDCSPQRWGRAPVPSTHQTASSLEDSWLPAGASLLEGLWLAVLVVGGASSHMTPMWHTWPSDMPVIRSKHTHHNSTVYSVREMCYKDYDIVVMCKYNMYMQIKSNRLTTESFWGSRIIL